MESIQVLQAMFYILMSLALFLLIVFLALGIALMLKIRRYVSRAAEGLITSAQNAHSEIASFLGGFLKYPIIGFIIKRIMRRIK